LRPSLCPRASGTPLFAAAIPLCALCIWVFAALPSSAFAQVAADVAPSLAPAEAPAEAPSVEPVDAADPSLPRILGVRVEGLYRVSEETVRRQIQVEVGKPLDRDAITEDIKRVYRLGFFEDVRVARRVTDAGVELLFQLVERPSINEVRLDGNDEVDEDDINKVIDLRKASILSLPQVERNVSKVRDVYVDEGYYLAQVSYELVPLPNNLVDVVFRIKEGEEVKVKTITFVGNEKVDDDTLSSNIFTRAQSPISFLDQSGQFKPEAFRQDIQLLRMIYLDRGYVKVDVDEPVVTLSPDREHMHITIHIDEGEQYSVGEVDVAGATDADFIVPKEEISALVTLKKGEVFSRKTIVEDTIRISDLYKDAGYANVSVSNSSRTDDTNRVVDFSYIIQRGEKVYFRFIEIQGNLTTRDKVIRREMQLAEGDLYSSTSIKASQREISRLGFFDDVKVTTKPTDDPNLVDVVVQVKERDTGTFQIGAGFSSIDSFILTAQIAKQNLFGRGQTLSFNATLSPVRTIFSISFFEPYFFDSPFTFGFELFNIDTDLNGFTRSSTGGELTFGYRITRDLWTTLTYRIEDVQADIGGTQSRAAVPVANLFRNGLTSSLRGSVIWDGRNNRINPTAGWYLQGSAEFADGFLGSDNEFLRLRGNGRVYVPLFWDIIFRVNGNIGYITSTGSQDVPIYERFFVGGIFTVRGFFRNSLGPEYDVARSRDPATLLSGFNIGGNKQLYFNTEIELPILADLGIRAVGFFDFGNAYDNAEPIDPSLFRYSAGFGIRWWSPVGPLRFEWGFPLDRQPGEDPMVFEFTIGNAF
jgi:outer membrane protein insertion porin family